MFESTYTYCLNGHLREPANLNKSGNCKTCARQRSSEWHSKNKESQNAKRKEHYRANKDHHLQQARIYVESNKEIVAERKKAWNIANKDRLKEKAKSNYEKNKDQRLAKVKEWHLLNKDKVSLHKKANKHFRRVALKDSPFPSSKWKEFLGLFNGWCPFCGLDSQRLTVGHVLPVTRGGTNDINNLIPQCLKCNQSQGKKTLDEWMPDLFNGDTGWDIEYGHFAKRRAA